MILPDVNVLVYAHRRDATDHGLYLGWLESTVNSDSAYGLSDLTLSEFIRVVTHPRIFNSPSTLNDAMHFANQIRNQPNCVTVSPGVNHWYIFEHLCSSVGARGNLIPDAYFAALAIEHGCEWITTDHDFARFPDLTWRHPIS